MIQRMLQFIIYDLSVSTTTAVLHFPRGDAARVLWGLWIFMSLIVSTIYRSNLKAMLIIPKLELPFDSMEELIESGLTTAVIKGTSMHLDIVASIYFTTYQWRI